MKSSVRKFTTALMVMIASLFFLGEGVEAQGFIVDHTCTDLSQIPDSWINQVKSTLKVHYAHTSHGEQIYTGLDRLSSSNNQYAFYPDNCTMPATREYLAMMEGQALSGYCETYVTPEYYWEGTRALNITRGMLNTQDINVSMWAWCTQLDYYSSSQVQAYLDAMAQLESEYPGVTFVYFTGNAQSEDQNRVDRNNQIRDYCRQNNKILFDFADLDCWYGGEQYTVNGIPMEHPQYHGDEAGHTTYGSCDNKAKAFWWLLARIAGWDGGGGGGGVVPFNLDIKVNGSDESLSVPQGTLISVKINVTSGSSAGRNADWWVAATTPFAYPGNWYSYVYPTGWHEGINLCLQNPIFDLSSFEVMNSALPPGNYRFYFVVDDPDGVALGPWWDMDWVDVQVTQ
jgi:hypothetical protein